MTKDEVIKTAKIGDLVHIKDEAPTNIKGRWVKIIAIFNESEDKSNPDFLVELNGIMKLRDPTKNDGWTIDKCNIHEVNNGFSSGYEALMARIQTEEVYGRWLNPYYIDDVKSGNSSGCKAFQPKSEDEKSQQLRKDINFFFKDLAEPWESPKKNGFEFL
jgi:hypothetical protein